MDITGTRLGNRVIEAVMVPCKESEMHRGLEVLADTPPETQRRIYLACISGELREQDARELGLPRSTVDYQVKKLQLMLGQFLADYPR